MRDEAVVRTPFVHRLSLSAIGTPTSGRSRHRSRSRSMLGRAIERLLARHGVERVQRRVDAPRAGRAPRGRRRWQNERARARRPESPEWFRLTHPMTRGTLNSPASGRRIGRIGQRGLRGRAMAGPRPGDRRDTARARWRLAERCACPPAALRRRTRGYRRAGARTARSRSRPARGWRGLRRPTTSAGVSSRGMADSTMDDLRFRDLDELLIDHAIAKS